MRALHVLSTGDQSPIKNLYSLAVNPLQRPAAQPPPAPVPPAPAPPVQTLTRPAKPIPPAPPQRGLTPGNANAVRVNVEIPAGLLNPDEVPVQQRTRHVCNDDMGQKKRFSVQTKIGVGVPYHRTNAGLRKAKEVAEMVMVLLTFDINGAAVPGCLLNG